MDISFYDHQLSDNHGMVKLLLTLEREEGEQKEEEEEEEKQ
jgi:hypothetical protein